MSEAQADRLARLGGLYAIVGDLDPVGRAEAVVAGGARVVQVRMKRSGAGAILDAARRIAALARGRALVLVNDRPDLALLAGADGVHLGEEDLPVAEARSLVGPALLVGRTVRTLEEALAALAAGADHVGYGPVFPSATKPLAIPPRGLEDLAAACAALPAPVVAISGVTLENIGAVSACDPQASWQGEPQLGRRRPSRELYHTNNNGVIRFCALNTTDQHRVSLDSQE